MSTRPRGGPFGRQHSGASPGCRAIQLWAAGASVAWAAIVLAYAIGFWSVAASGQGRGTLFLDAMFFLLTLAVPLVLVWLAAFLAAELARQRELIAALAGVAAPLLEGLAATRDALERQSPTAPEALHRAVEAAVSGLVRPVGHHRPARQARRRAVAAAARRRPHRRAAAEAHAHEGAGAGAGAGAAETVVARVPIPSRRLRRRRTGRRSCRCSGRSRRGPTGRRSSAPSTFRAIPTIGTAFAR